MRRTRASCSWNSCWCSRSSSSRGSLARMPPCRSSSMAATSWPCRRASSSGVPPMRSTALISNLSPWVRRKSRTLIMPLEAARWPGVRSSWFLSEQLAPFSTSTRMPSTSPVAAHWHMRKEEKLTLSEPPLARMSFWISTWRWRTAQSSGLRPSASHALASACFSSRYTTTSRRPSDAAMCKAVRWLWSGALGDTPLSMSRFTSSRLRSCAAWHMSWPPLIPSRNSRPPFSRRNLATASCLWRTASLRLELRKQSSALTSAPFSMRNLIISSWPSEAATCSGVRLSVSDTLTLSLLSACFIVAMSPCAAALSMSLVRSALRRARSCSTRLVSASCPAEEPRSSSSSSDFMMEFCIDSSDAPPDPFSLSFFCDEPDDLVPLELWLRCATLPDRRLRACPDWASMLIMDACAMRSSSSGKCSSRARNSTRGSRIHTAPVILLPRAPTKCRVPKKKAKSPVPLPRVITLSTFSVATPFFFTSVTSSTDPLITKNISVAISPAR
mmetsp:Transcript_5269/g.17064  ORF Transcript_5269/g.17064 Transcript_5269/m.17064 type:complete len:500 (+) Transcript_5269:561-2060(+)